MAKKEEVIAEEQPGKGKKGTLAINIAWNGKDLLAGAPAPDGLEAWLKKTGKEISEYIVVEG